jgi:hypothetical protein
MKRQRLSSATILVVALLIVGSSTTGHASEPNYDSADPHNATSFQAPLGHAKATSNADPSTGYVQFSGHVRNAIGLMDRTAWANSGAMLVKVIHLEDSGTPTLTAHVHIERAELTFESLPVGLVTDKIGLSLVVTSTVCDCQVSSGQMIASLSRDDLRGELPRRYRKRLIEDREFSVSVTLIGPDSGPVPAGDLYVQVMPYGLASCAGRCQAGFSFEGTSALSMQLA